MKLANEYEPESVRKIRLAKTNCDKCLPKSSVSDVNLLKVFRRGFGLRVEVHSDCWLDI